MFYVPEGMQQAGSWFGGGSRAFGTHDAVSRNCRDACKLHICCLLLAGMDARSGGVGVYRVRSSVSGWVRVDSSRSQLWPCRAALQTLMIQTLKDPQVTPTHAHPCLPHIHNGEADVRQNGPACRIATAGRKHAVSLVDGLL